MSNTFKKNIEDFECSNCGNYVEGNGYTNHCPKCLYSKHVDIYPGDRENKCKGLMEPVSVKEKDKIYVITHRCTNCEYKKENKTHKKDNFDAIIFASTNEN